MRNPLQSAAKRPLLLNLLPFLLLLAAAAALLLAQKASISGRTAKRNIIVYVGGQEYTRQPLEAGKTLVIEQDSGARNEILMTENGFLMHFSTCDNQLCVMEGEVNTENWHQRALINHVICLPNQVDVVLELTDEEQSSWAQSVPDI